VISFNLRCSNGHEFEGWFSNSSDFDAQAARGLVECPYCGDKSVEKGLMAPAIATSPERDGKVSLVLDQERREAVAQLRALINRIRETSEDVGDRFAEEARKIHYGEAEERGIHGRATVMDMRSLAEEGIPFMALPALPEEKN